MIPLLYLWSYFINPYSRDPYTLFPRLNLFHSLIKSNSLTINLVLNFFYSLNHIVLLYDPFLYGPSPLLSPFRISGLTDHTNS